MKLRYLPNLITLSRMAMAPPIGWLIVQGHLHIAAVAFVLVAATDAVDGFLAKTYDWQTRLGGVLDPVADKLLMLVTTGALWWSGGLPTWFLLLVLSRDLLIVIGAYAFHQLFEPFVAAPSPISKLTTMMQATMLTAVMLNGYAWVNDMVCQLLLVATTVLIVASGAHYVARYTRRAIAIYKQRA